MQPRVSIILPTFNRLQYLRTAVASVFAQSFQDWELLLADDGSDAETKAYLQGLTLRPQVRILWLAHTGNPPAVRNAALREAQGEYIAFLDSDDVWLPDKLSAQVGSLSASPAHEWGCTGFTFVDGSGAPLVGKQARRYPPTKGAILDPLVRGDATIVQSSVIARRELLQKVGGYDEELPVCGDYALWIRIAQQFEVDFVDAPLVQVRRHAEHYADAVAALEDLKRMLEKVLRSSPSRRLDSVLQRRRANVAVSLAHAHALRRRHLRVIKTLMGSIPYSWRLPEWWGGALIAMARSLAPAALLDFARRRRGH